MHSKEKEPTTDGIRLVIKKSERTLEIYSADRCIRSIKVSLGADPFGDKEKEGDGKTPEGSFYVFTKNPQSRYFLSLGLSYPNAEDAERGLADGLITTEEYSAIVAAINEGKMPPQNTALGGEIYIHGGGIEGDWTRGCVALNDDVMGEIFDLVSKGTLVTILP